MVSINTNGSLINGDILKLFAEYPPSRVNVSLYGGCDQTYEALCGNPAYHRVTENIQKLRALNIDVKINCSVIPDNAADIQDIYAFGRKVNVPVQATTYMYPPVRINGGQYGNAPARFSAKQAAHYQLICREQHMTEAQLTAMANHIREWNEDCGRGEFGPMRCRAGRTAFWVTWDGRMLPCGMFSTEGYSIPVMVFASAWHAVRQDSQAIVLPRECSGCSKQDHCSACAASCLAENGDTRIKPRYICEMTQILDNLTKEKYGKENPL
jgi:MoaA/NifB/PqqE/SkfB family radical SAM enzyme